jgi:hypothetical protein
MKIRDWFKSKELRETDRLAKEWACMDAEKFGQQVMKMADEARVSKLILVVEVEFAGQVEIQTLAGGKQVVTTAATHPADVRTLAQMLDKSPTMQRIVKAMKPRKR